MAVTEKRRLARGLDALLGSTLETHDSDATTGPVTQVALDRIERNPYQPRKDFDPTELNSLRQSLATHGLLQPVVVRSTPTGYQLIAGERRLRAARENGWKEIPVRVVDFSDRQVFEAAMVENLQRADLNAIEKAHGFQDYVNQYGVTHEELAQRMGLDRTTITNLLRLLELPVDVQDAVRTGQITAGHAKALLTADDPVVQTAICKDIVARGLSVRATEALVRQAKPVNGEEKVPAAPAVKTPHVQAIEDELRQRFATRVEIKLRGPDKGQLILTFDSNDDFERITEALRRVS